MDKAQIARLKEVAEKANPGGWEMVIGHPHSVVTAKERWPVADVESCNDAAFIAAANPAAILELIAENARLEREADWLAERMACECRGDDSVCGWCDKVNEIGAPYCVSMTKEKWREAARKAVEKEEANG